MEHSTEEIGQVTVTIDGDNIVIHEIGTTMMYTNSLCEIPYKSHDRLEKAERIRDLWNAFVGITTHKAMNIIQAAKSLMDNPDDLKYLELGPEMEAELKYLCKQCGESIGLNCNTINRDTCSTYNLLTKLEGG